MIDLTTKNLFLFDFGDTLFETISYDFEKGLEAISHLLDIYGKYPELKSTAGELKFLFDKRDSSIFEIDLKKYLKLLLELVVPQKNMDFSEIEMVLWKNSSIFSLFLNVRDLLE